MALDIMSSTVNNSVKISQPAEPVREVKTAEPVADVSKLTASGQIERQVVTTVNQDGTNTEQKDNENAARLQAAVKRANSSLQQSHRTSCQFAYDDKTNRISITVMDDETNEVIREIPSEEALELVHKMWEMAGLLVDEQR